MRYLITGAAGYIGGNFKLYLERQNIDIICVDNFSASQKKAFGKTSIHQIDISDHSSLSELFSAQDITGVFHFAGKSIVSESILKPSIYWRDNLIACDTLCSVAVAAGVRNFVFSSTAAVYGNPVHIPITEDTIPQPINAYGRSKYATEMLLADYHKRYGINVGILRYFNAAGADPNLEHGESHDPETHLIPSVIKRLLHGEPIEIFGNDYDTADGTCIRDYIHVMDLASAHLAAMRYLETAGGIVVCNLGSGKGNSVHEIVSAIQKEMRMSAQIEIRQRRPGDPDKLVADISRSQSLLEWRPTYTLQDIVSTAVAWEKARCK